MKYYALLCIVFFWSCDSMSSHAQPVDIEKTRGHFDKRSPLFLNLPDCRKNFHRIAKQTTEKGKFMCDNQGICNLLQSSRGGANLLLPY